MSSINDLLGRVLTIGKANLSDDKAWRDFYRLGVLPVQNMPEPSPGPTISRIIPELEIILYMKLMSKIQLLASLGKIEPKEAARLVSMLDSPDPESWTLAEAVVQQKLSSL